MGKRDNVYDSGWIGAAPAVDRCREASNRGGEFGVRGERRRGCARRQNVCPNVLAIWQAAGARESWPLGLSRAATASMMKSALRQSPCARPATVDEPSGTCGAVEIEFAAGIQLRSTGAVNAATPSAVMGC
jgi:hypothetical protein